MESVTKKKKSPKKRLGCCSCDSKEEGNHSKHAKHTTSPKNRCRGKEYSVRRRRKRKEMNAKKKAAAETVGHAQGLSTGLNFSRFNTRGRKFAGRTQPQASFQLEMVLDVHNLE